MTHNHDGLLGAVLGTLSYFAVLAMELIPDYGHFVQGIFTAVCCAGAGWLTTTICKEVYNYCKPTFRQKTVKFFKNVFKRRK